MWPETIYALIIVGSIFFAAVGIARRQRQQRIRRGVVMRAIIQWWDEENAQTPNSEVGLTLRTASCLLAADRYDDALEVLDWFWAPNDLPTAARVCGLRAMALVYNAKGSKEAAEECHKWANELLRSSS